MLCLSGFDLYSRWVPLNVQGINSKNHLFWLSLHRNPEIEVEINT